MLNDDANVYKLIGPVLVKQDLAEANANVRKRIDYISAELYVFVSLNYYSRFFRGLFFLIYLYLTSFGSRFVPIVFVYSVASELYEFPLIS